MAHHQGMSLLSLAYLLLDRPMQKRFESDPLFQATTLLLQERVPKATASYAHAAELSGLRTTPGVTEMPVRVFRHPRHSRAGGAAAVERQIPRDDHERGRRVQPLEGHRGDALARRRHLRQLGHVLLHPRRGKRGVLVHRLPADAQATGEVRGDLLGGAGGVPPPRPRLRHAHGNRRLARGRHRGAPGPHHQPLPDAQDDRDHELRGSRSRIARRGRAASGVQQSLRPDRDRPRSGRRSSAPAGPAPPASRRRGCST